MAYYVVLQLDVHDEETFRAYQRAAFLAKSDDMRVLAFDATPRDLEGQSRKWLAVLEFDTEEAAMRWYQSDAYQEAAKLRRASTEGWVRGVPGFGAQRG